jgi:hypothetical protein
MERPNLDHLLRAAGDATGQKIFVLVGSAAIFAWRRVVPAHMAMSREADLFAFDVSERDAERIADELDGDLGQQSQFDETHGYCVDGVEPKTVVLPEDWRDRSKTHRPGQEAWWRSCRTPMTSPSPSFAQGARKTSNGWPQPVWRAWSALPMWRSVLVTCPA